MPADNAASQPAEPPETRRWRRALTRRPLMLCSLGFVSGMALAHLTRPGMLAFALVALGAGVVLTASAMLAPRTSAAPLLIGFLALGGVQYEYTTRVPRSDLCHTAGAEGLTIAGTVIAPPRDTGWRRSVRIEVHRIGTDGRMTADATGRAEARVPRDPELHAGDRVVLTDASVKLPTEAEEPGQFDYRAWLARQGVRSVVNAGGIAMVGHGDSLSARLMRMGLRLRRRVVGAIERAMPGADGPLYSRLLVGMVYGLEAAPLPDEVVEQFRRAGTIHLLVVSGAQISMLAIAIVGLTGWGLKGVRWWQAVLAGLGVGVLVLIVGMEASVGRAVAMFALVMLAALTSRDYDVYTSLALAAAVIVAADPRALLSLSFQLTFAATLGVIVFLPEEPLKRIDNSIAASPLPQVRALAWATIGAWVMTAPLLAHSVSGFALSGNLANLANVPLSGLILVLGFVALPLALLSWGWVLTPVCLLARGLLSIVMHVNEVAAGLPMPFVEQIHLGPLQCVTCYALVGLGLAVGLHRRAQRTTDEFLLRLHPSWPPVAGLAICGGLVATLATSGLPPDELELTLLPVGAGQCAVVRAPSGGTLMVDCGGGGNYPRAGREIADGVVVPWLVRRRIDRVDVVAITHWDTDHCNALPRLLEVMPAGTLILPPELPDAQIPNQLRGPLPARPVWAKTGGRLALDEDVAVELLAPRLPRLRGTGDDANANSVVMMVKHGEVRMLLTGDINAAGARRLVRDARNTGRSLQADVLVLPHHGRGLSTLEPLLDAVQPRWAVASCDDRADYYLSDEQTALLERRGIGLLRTDEEGVVRLATNGRRVRVSASRGRCSIRTWVAAARG